MTASLFYEASCSFSLRAFVSLKVKSYRREKQISTLSHYEVVNHLLEKYLTDDVMADPGVGMIQ